MAKTGITEIKLTIITKSAIAIRLLTYLSKGNSSVFVLVHLFNDLLDLLLRDVEATRLDHSSEFFTRDGTTVVQIHRVEGLVDVEVWHALESLSNGLSLNLTLEVASPKGSERDLSVWQEAVITSVGWVPVVGWSAVHHAGIVWVKSKESFTELSHVESTVTSSVISCDEEIDLIR